MKKGFLVPISYTLWRKVGIALSLIFSILFAESVHSDYILGEGVHYLLGIHSDGVIELENECQFKILDHYIDVCGHWDLHDQITFVPNNQFFGGSQFYLVNLKKDESVPANIWRSPNLDNPYTDYLLQINESCEEIILSNHQGIKTRWKVHADDFQELLKHWKIGASVVIGKNNGGVVSRWFSSDPYILISYRAMRRNLYVRGTQISMYAKTT